MRKRCAWIARPAILVAILVAAACSSSNDEEGRAPTPDAGPNASVSTDDAAASVDRDASDAAAVVGSTVSGKVTFLDAGAAKTSVLLARATDFDPNGFYEKLPDGPKAFDVTGAWSIADVPAGKYWVLAGFANDGFVSATAAPELVDVSGKPDDAVMTSQLLVPAVKIASITPRASTASVTIVDVAGEDEYRVSVHDFKNELVYSKTEPPATSGANVTFAIGTVLTVPIKYRVRVRAMKNGVELTRTEDLAGLFNAAPDDT